MDTPPWGAVGIGIGTVGGRLIVISTVGAEWRNLPAEWGC